MPNDSALISHIRSGKPVETLIEVKRGRYCTLVQYGRVEGRMTGVEGKKRTVSGLRRQKLRILAET